MTLRQGFFDIPGQHGSLEKLNTCLPLFDWYPDLNGRVKEKQWCDLRVCTTTLSEPAASQCYTTGQFRQVGHLVRDIVESSFKRSYLGALFRKIGVYITKFGVSCPHPHPLYTPLKKGENHVHLPSKYYKRFGGGKELISQTIPNPKNIHIEVFQFFSDDL